jgi:hypothetical protein
MSRASLFAEHRRLLDEEPRVTGPVVLMAVGSVITAAGVAGLFVQSGPPCQVQPCPSTTFGAISALGAGAVAAGVTWLVERCLARAEHGRRLGKIDAELLRRGVRPQEIYAANDAPESGSSAGGGGGATVDADAVRGLGELVGYGVAYVALPLLGLLVAGGLMALGVRLPGGLL